MATESPEEVLRKGEEAYQQNKKEWDKIYAGKFIAIKDGEIVCADKDRKRLDSHLLKLQKEGNRFRVYIVEIGKSLKNIK